MKIERYDNKGNVISVEETEDSVQSDTENIYERVRRLEQQIEHVRENAANIQPETITNATAKAEVAKIKDILTGKGLGDG